MKTVRSSPKLRLLCIIFLALLIIGTGIAYYLTQQYSKEWRYWKELSSVERRRVVRLVVELEVERVWHRIFRPSPRPEQYVHVTASTLENAMRLGADWILRMQEPSGRFQYWYDPVKNQFSKKWDDNFLRQAGTSFSLMLVYEMSGDSRYLYAARKSLDYLLGFKRQLDSDKAYFLFNRKAKLGGIALPMLSMLKVRQLTGSTEYDELLIQLANMILFLQGKYQTGQYKSTYVYRGDYEHEKNSGWESRIYPGEALFALANMFRDFGDVRYKRSMDRAMDFYYRKKWKSHAFLPWTISAFTALYEQTGDLKYADYVFFLSDRLLTQQNLDGDDEVYGSFHGFPSANTGSYMEGLGDALHLAQLVADEQRLQRYREYAKMGYRWLFLLQYTASHTANLHDPEMALGGIRKTPFDSQLRIDNTQHTISAFAKGLRRIFGQQPLVQPVGHFQ